MHVLTLTKALTRADGRHYKPGAYVCEDLTGAEWMIEAARGQSAMAPYHIMRGAQSDSVCVIANGGYGDCIMWTPAFRKFRKLWPNRGLSFVCRERSCCVFDGLPYTPLTIDYPATLATIRGHETLGDIRTSEHTQEDSTEGRTVHACDIKAGILGVTLDTDDERRCEYVVTQGDFFWANAKYPAMKRSADLRKRIGIQMAASSPTRSYHPKLMGDVLKQLWEAGHEIMLFASPGKLAPDLVPPMQRELIKNLSADNLTFRQSAAVVASCDAMFAPDSGLMHVAGALGVPTVAIFASTHWKLRTTQYPSVFALQGHAECAPCWHHPKGQQIFPAGMPCEKVGYCGPLNQISPDRIVAELNKKLEAA